MSDTAFISEVGREGGPRVTLTMDGDEVWALADVAQATIDSAVMLPATIKEQTASNAQQIFNWAVRAAGTLELAAPGAKE
jgi:hypothetical protein